MNKLKKICLLVIVSALFGGIGLVNRVKSEAVSSSDLVTRAYLRGSIDRKTYVLEKLKTYFAPDKVKRKFRSSFTSNRPTREISLLLIEAKLHFDSYSKDDQSFLSMLLKRPDSTSYNWPWGSKPSFYLPDPVKTFEPSAKEYPNIGGKFKFHYVTHNKPDGGNHIHKTTLAFVKKMAKAFETVYKKEITDMSYPAPPSDPADTDHGGDSKFDVYLMNCGWDGVYGYVSPEGLAADGDGNSYYSFMVMDNDFKEFVTSTQTAEDAMKVTAAHEYHHVIQNGINMKADSWYMEATSTWMEDQVYDSVDDNRQYLKNFFDNPSKSMDTWKGYGDWIFNEYLETEFEAYSIKTVWDNLDPVGSNEPLDAISAMLQSKSSSLKDAMLQFAAMNYSKSGYKDGTFYKTNYPVKIENSSSPHTLDFSSDTSSKVDEQSVSVDHMAVKYYKFVPGASLTDPTNLSITFTAASDKDVSAIIIAAKTDGTFVNYNFSFDSSGKGELGVPDFSVNTIKEVVLAVVNYSKTEDAITATYKAELLKAFVFVIDDTGSMSSAISAAKNAAVKVLNDNKAAGIKRLYTLISFKDGFGSLRGESSDEDTMKSLINTLSASGGGDLPESSLTAIRQAANHASNADILMMTDAPSNSYGVDGTYADWGEVALTIATLLEHNCNLNVIYFNTSSYAPSPDKRVLSDNNNTTILRVVRDDNASGSAGYNRIAYRTGGLYFSSASVDTSVTETWAEMILRKSSMNCTILNEQGSGEKSFTLPIDSTITAFQVILNPSDSSASLSMTVKNPSGKTITDADSNVTVLSSSGSISYRVEGNAVAQGNWTVEITGTGSYTLQAEASSSNTMTYTGDTNIGIGDTVSLSAVFKEATTGVSFQLVNQDDSSDTVDLTMTSNDNLTYTGTTTLNSPVSYQFIASGSNYFRRIASGIIKVSDVKVTSTYDSINVYADSKILVSFTVKNLSSQQDTYTISVGSKYGWADTSDIDSSLTLDANASQSISVPVSVPADLDPDKIESVSLQAVSSSDNSVAYSKSVRLVPVTYQDIEIPKVTITVDSGKTGKDRVIIQNAKLPSSAYQEIDSDDSVSVSVGSKTFVCDDTGKWKKSGKDGNETYTYKSAKDNTDGIFQLVLNFKKNTWSFKASRADMNSYITLPNMKIILNINGVLYGKALTLNHRSSWQFDGKKHSTSSVDSVTTNFTISFDTAKCVGKIDTAKTNKDNFSISKAGIEFSGVPNYGTLKLDDTTVYLNSFTQLNPKKNVYIYKSKGKGLPTLNLVIDLDKKIWSVKYSNSDCSGITPYDGINVILTLNGYYTGAIHLNTIRKDIYFIKQ